MSKETNNIETTDSPRRCPLLLRNTILDPSLTYRTVKAQFLRDNLVRQRKLLAAVQAGQTPHTVVCPLQHGPSIPLVTLHVLEKAADLKRLGMNVKFVISGIAAKTGPSQKVLDLLRALGFQNREFTYTSGEWRERTNLEIEWRVLSRFFAPELHDRLPDLKWHFDSIGFAFFQASEPHGGVAQNDQTAPCPRVIYLTGQCDAHFLEQFHKAQSGPLQDPAEAPIPLYVPLLPLKNHIWLDDSVDDMARRLREAINELPDARAQLEFLADIERYFAKRDRTEHESEKGLPTQADLTDNVLARDSSDIDIYAECNQVARSLKGYVDRLSGNRK